MMKTIRTGWILPVLMLLAGLGALAQPAEARADFEGKRLPAPPPPEPEPEPEPAAEEPPESSGDERSLTGWVRFSGQQVERSDRRLAATAGGATAIPRSESGFFGTLGADLSGRSEHSLTDDLLLVVQDHLRLDKFDPERVNSERYGFLDNRARADLGARLNEATLLDLGGFWDFHEERFDPRFRARTFGGDMTLDRELSGFRNLTGAVDYRRTTFPGLGAEDHDQARVTMGFFRYWPETVDVDILPVPPPEPRGNPEAFEYASDLQLNRSRPQMLDFGAGRIARMSRTPDPLPLAKRVLRERVGRREAAFGATAAFARRWADLGGAGSFQRGSLDLFATRASGEDVVWTLEEQLDYTERDSEDLSRFLFDSFDNRVGLERARLGTGSQDRTRGAIESLLARDRTAFDTHRLVFDQYSYRHFGQRYGYTFWFRGFQRLNRTPVLDYQERAGYRSQNTFTVDFGARSALDLSLLYERTVLDGLETIFDSTYASRTVEARYRYKMTSHARAELGYRDEQERHRAFLQNNRDEKTVFVDFVADL